MNKLSQVMTANMLVEVGIPATEVLKEGSNRAPLLGLENGPRSLARKARRNPGVVAHRLASFRRRW